MWSRELFTRWTQKFRSHHPGQDSHGFSSREVGRELEVPRVVSVMLVGAEQTRGVDFQFVGTRMMAMIAIPVLASLLIQRYIVRGLSLGAVKG